MKKLLPISLVALVSACDSSIALNNSYDWSVINVDEKTLDDDDKSTTILYTKEEKVNIHGDLFNEVASIKLLKNFDRTKDGNNRLTEVKHVFKECEHRAEMFGSKVLKTCIKGTGINDSVTKKSSSIIYDIDKELITVSYENINDSVYIFDTVINENVELDWVHTHFSYNINTKVGSVKVGFTNGEAMTCDNYMPNSIHQCEYKGIKSEIPPMISDDIFSDLDYKANEKFVDITARFDQEIAGKYLDYLQGSGLY